MTNKSVISFNKALMLGLLASPVYGHDNRGKFEPEEIFAIAFGAVVGFIFLVLLVVCCCLRKGSKNRTTPVKDDDVELGEKKEQPKKKEEPKKTEQPKPEPVKKTESPKAKPQENVEPAPPPRESTPPRQPTPPPPGPTPEQENAARIITRAMRTNMYRKQFGRKLRKYQEEQIKRKMKLAKRAAGSVGIKLEKDMSVGGLTPGGAGEAAGVQVDDILTLITTYGRGGRPSVHAIEDRTTFLEYCGPQNEVFEDTTIEVTFIRDPESRAIWHSMRPEMEEPGDYGKAYDDWVATVNKLKPVTLSLTLKEETEGVKANRVKQMTRLKEERGLEKMDVELCNNFMGDPEACQAFTRQVFEKCDVSKTGSLNLKELDLVFIEMAEVTGCSIPSEKTQKALLSDMDETNNGSVTFDEFFPVFRAYTIKAIAKNLYK